MKMETLFKESIFPGTEYFVAQTRFVQKPATGLHNHNFYEAFIVVSGSMAHVINGNRAVMHPYSLALVFPEDTHEFLQLQEDEVRFVNLAFSENVFRTACRMYEAASDKPLQNGFAAMQLDPELGRQLIGRIYSLNRAGFGDRVFGGKLLPALVADIFMLSDTYDDTAPAMPQWLVNAVIVNVAFTPFSKYICVS